MNMTAVHIPKHNVAKRIDGKFNLPPFLGMSVI